MLKEWKIWGFSNTKMTKPTDKDKVEGFESLESKARRVILDGVKYHLITHLTQKKIVNDMWDTLNRLFESKNKNRKMTLNDKLHNIKMNKDEGVASYITRVAQFKDELAVVGDIVPNSELVRIALKGFIKNWDVFVKCIVGKEKLPNWSILLDDFTQEDIQEGSLGI